jgi:Trypsin-co-occurring domain 1
MLGTGASTSCPAHRASQRPALQTISQPRATLARNVVASVQVVDARDGLYAINCCEPSRHESASIRDSLIRSADGEDPMSEARVWIETVQLDPSGSRQIGTKNRTAALLRDRRDDIEAAVREASTIVQESVSKSEDTQGWQVSRLEARFGLTLTAEAGVIVSRASAEASFEVTITVERA